MGHSPLAIFTKFCMGEGVTGPHPAAKFNPFGLKNVSLQPPRSPKLVFLVKICPKGVYPLNRFLPNLALGGLLGLHPHAQFFRYGFKNVGPNIAKSGNFWYIFAQKR